MVTEDTDLEDAFYAPAAARTPGAPGPGVAVLAYAGDISSGGSGGGASRGGAAVAAAVSVMSGAFSSVGAKLGSIMSSEPIPLTGGSNAI